MVNNIKNEIKHFIKEFCMLVEDPKDSRLLFDDKLIKYEGIIYYLPNTCSLMDENDLLLKEMLIATFSYEL